MKRIYIKPASEIVMLNVNGKMMAAETDPSLTVAGSLNTTHGTEEAKYNKFFEEYEEDSGTDNSYSVWDE